MEIIEHENPVRQYMDDPDIQWKHGKPDYTVVNNKYLTQKSKSHPSGSVEKLVENLVKTWEMESSHKINEKDWKTADMKLIFFRVGKTADNEICFFLQDWKTVDKDLFTIKANDGRTFGLKDNIEIGNYNMMMWNSPLYNKAQSNADSHKVFKQAFPGGFAWEVVKVFSGPPDVSFTWRHWGKWEGPYEGNYPTGENIELTGHCFIVVNSDLKIESIEVFYDPNPMLATLSNFKRTDHKSNGCPM